MGANSGSLSTTRRPGVALLPMGLYTAGLRYSDPKESDPDSHSLPW